MKEKVYDYNQGDRVHRLTVERDIIDGKLYVIEEVVE